MLKALFLACVLCPKAAWCSPPPVNSPDWLMLSGYHDAEIKTEEHCLVGCFQILDARPINPNGFMFDRGLNLYKLRYNRKRWQTGMVSETPRSGEEGDEWLTVFPGQVTFAHGPRAFTMAWVETDNTARLQIKETE